MNCTAVSTLIGLIVQSFTFANSIVIFQCTLGFALPQQSVLGLHVPLHLWYWQVVSVVTVPMTLPLVLMNVGSLWSIACHTSTIMDWYCSEIIRLGTASLYNSYTSSLCTPSPLS